MPFKEIQKYWTSKEKSLLPVGKCHFFLHIYWCNLKQPVCSTGAILPTCHEMSIKCIKVHFTSQFSFHFLLMINLTFALGWVKRMRTAILLFLAGTLIYQINGGKNLQNGISYRQSKKVTITSFDTFTEKKTVFASRLRRGLEVG